MGQTSLFSGVFKTKLFILLVYGRLNKKQETRKCFRKRFAICHEPLVCYIEEEKVNNMVRWARNDSISVYASMMSTVGYPSRWQETAREINSLSHVIPPIRVLMYHHCSKAYWYISYLFNDICCLLRTMCALVLSRGSKSVSFAGCFIYLNTPEKWS